MIDKSNLTAVILAGGRSSRMNGEDKGLILLNGKPMIAYVATVVKEKAGHLFISANRNIEQYQEYGKVITDALDDFQGPLAGILQALQSANTDYLLIFPCDAPLLNKVAVDQLLNSMRQDMDIGVADDGIRMHPTMMIVKTKLAQNLVDFLASGQRKLGLWVEQNNFLKINLSAYPEIFTNLNTPEDFNKCLIPNTSFD
ncbi:Molybdenum cofactor guanylyltransferase (EC [Bathymodiolus thermophilus thioautotrophic gill symbiont]|uniref:molybdenum cofactor guanylyltransferase MobA n=1 Tax=Bathymodiolus thermophilus thioautotrophic gill symbiont TaxID=2360 RepID=UPI00192ACD4B|nr:molybdenum cofactor guanylyltransferase MobA [Bathymodiolus thermophilus thioautotrophic gill symbiont]CAB5496182.1 Molybdenum cofactor guanylyltransferase (EC [Bathymodiolus thermophilus thioautotrophic gill symbiont]